MLLVLLGSSGGVFAAQRIPAEAWRRVRVYDMQELKNAEPPLRQFVGVRFHYRHAKIRHVKPTWHQGSIWRYNRGARENFDYIQVMVSTADVPAFKAFPSSLDTVGEFTVYGQILKEVGSDFVFLRLVGTKVNRDKAGNALVSW
ncbi:MAG: hypothetical protein H0V56_04015 [Chthoniobacterales bacterium]|nr:hypothetical protein [Chthoniobacterales bacterium]